jgi:L-amino acid N-acyltransferase YncA
MMAHRWKQIAALRRTPLLLLAQKVARRVPFRPIDRGKLSFQRLDGVTRVAPAMSRGPAAVREATGADIDALARLHHSREIFAARFDTGDRCIVAMAGGNVVGYEWFCANATHHETAWNYTIDVPDGCVYAYDAFIDPAFRNSGIWLRFKAMLADWMLATDKHWVLTFVDYGNDASLRTHQRFGFKRAQTIVAVKVLGRSFFFSEASRDSRAPRRRNTAAAPASAPAARPSP